MNASAQCEPDVVCVVEKEDRWLISSNMTVDALHIKGILKWDDTLPDLVLTAGWIFIDEGGVFQVGSMREPIGWYPGVTAMIYIKKAAINTHKVYGDRFLMGCGGTVRILGMPKVRTWTLLSRSVAMGSKELFLKDDPIAMGWRVGDEIGIATTSVGYSTRHRIVNISEATEEQLSVASATAGAQEPHLPATNTIDNNVGSLWSSYLGNAKEQWLRLDLATCSNVTRVRFHFQDPRYAPVYRVEVQRSPDGPWIVAATVTDGLAGWREVTVDQDEVTAIRMFADYQSMWNRGYRGERGHEPAWSGLWMNEVQVYGRKCGETMPTVIVLDTGVEADHMGGNKSLSGHQFEMAAEVVNLERNVLITGDHDDINITQEGLSTGMMDGGIMDVRYTRVEHCGRRNMMGKYCLHLHRVGTCTDCIFQGNAVVDSQQVGITIHDTHKALIDQNVIWDGRAAGVYIEDGNEMNNIFSSNVLICSHHDECAVSWNGKGSDQTGGFYIVGMTNHFLYNRVVGYKKGFYSAGMANPEGQGYAWGHVCPRHMPFGQFRGNVNHDCIHYGLYLDHQYPRQLERDENGYVTSGCGEFTEDGRDNGVVPAQVIEDQFEWHNTFVGQYAMGDISFFRFTSMNNGHSIYWKTSKNFADNVSHHMRECIFGNDPHDPIGRLQIYGPSGPFTFKFTDNIFVGGPVGSAALCAGQHCGLGGAGGPCTVQYLMQNISWSGLMDWQKKVQFGVNAASFGYVQPILLSKDNFSLGGYRAMVSQHLNGFKKLGCQQQSWEWDNAFACDLPIRRLNFWSNVDQGNVTLIGPGYDVEPNFADPVEGLNAGLMKFEPMHRGYGLPVVAGLNYSVIGSWHGDVAVEFSDRDAAEYYGIAQDNLTLDVVNGTSCSLTSNDPRNYLSPLGTAGQAQGVQLEEVLNCMIEGRRIVVERREDPEPVNEAPPGRLNGTCEFGLEPAMTYHWDPYCFFGGLGCFADGKNPECGFCGKPPFKDCSSTTTTAPPTTETTTTTTTTTALVDRTIKSLLGTCLAASADLDSQGYVEMATCNHGNFSQQWTWNEDSGTIKNILCLHVLNGSDVLLDSCWPGNAHQNFTYNRVNGQIVNQNGLCLEAPPVGGPNRAVVVATCVEYARKQQWSIGSWELPTTTSTLETTVTTTLPTTSEERLPLQRQYVGYNCALGLGAAAVPNTGRIDNVSLAACKQECARESLCEGILFREGEPRACWLRMDIVLERCNKNTELDLWMKGEAPATTQTTTTTLDQTIKGFSGWCLSAPDPSSSSKAVDMLACSPGSGAQNWAYMADLQAFMNNMNLCLHVGSDLTADVSECAVAQTRWTFDLTTGQLKTQDGLCLEAPSATSLSEHVIVRECSDTQTSQIWTVGDWESFPTTTSTSTIPTTVTTTSTSTALVLSGHIRNQAEAEVCVEAPQHYDGGIVQVHACDSQNRDELWTYEPSAWISGTGVIRNELNRCLDAPQSVDDGTMIHVWWCHGNTNQLWSYDPSTAQIKHVNDMCLTGTLDALEQGKGRLRLAVCDPRSLDQQWRFENL